MLGELSSPQPRTRMFAVTFTSLDGMRIGGWLTRPRDEPVERGVVVGHSYGGREEPDFHLPFRRAVLIFSCARGISRSACADIPSNPDDHVLHGIERRETYVHMVVARPIRCGAPPRRCWSCSRWRRDGWTIWAAASAAASARRTLAASGEGRWGGISATRRRLQPQAELFGAGGVLSRQRAIHQNPLDGLGMAIYKPNAPLVNSSDSFWGKVRRVAAPSQLRIG
jgi:hypothetical protein